MGDENQITSAPHYASPIGKNLSVSGTCTIKDDASLLRLQERGKAQPRQWGECPRHFFTLARFQTDA